MSKTTGFPIPVEAKKFTPRDSLVFVAKLAVAGVLIAGSVAWIFTHGWVMALPGQFLLGVMFAHVTELQHQVLHGTGLRSRRASRVVGTALGAPMMVAYSRYKGLHLIHHRCLGTEKDTEFFTYAVTGNLTLKDLVVGAFDVRRWTVALWNILTSPLPGRRYDSVLSPFTWARVRTEYQVMLMCGLALTVLSVAAGEPLVVTLWLIPLVFAEPIHFLIELPEHVLCDRTTTDTFKNTRTVKGSWFSFWLTNGNNFHTEHHLRMGVPIHKLGVVHAAVADRLDHYCATYPRFYRMVLIHAWRATRGVT
ncbi:fatty acid desaturase [Streptomyces sp. NPDC050523]|uniref:fatty acid desaturase n=1 Tax=Streptomyces sp. NPDC050523 TaxID=3365622 RepID=UPI0037A88ED1